MYFSGNGWDEQKNAEVTLTQIFSSWHQNLNFSRKHRFLGVVNEDRASFRYALPIHKKINFVSINELLKIELSKILLILGCISSKNLT